MKKSAVSVDFASFGEAATDNNKKLEAFVENVKSTEGSHLVVIPPESLLSDALVATPILGGSAQQGGMGGAGGDDIGGDEFGYGVDLSNDPELALALRMSLEEEKARQEKERRAQEESEAKEGKAPLEGIAEEDEKDVKDENAPLLPKDGEGGSSSASGEPKSDKKDGPDSDKMDTA
jgi:26S proteasome regulatory subunit N10